MDERTIRIVPDASYPVPVLKMLMSDQVHADDIEYAFQQIGELSSKSASPCYIIIDLSNNPKVPPPSKIVQSALGGAYEDPNVQEWLMIGVTEEARFIENTMWGMTKRHHVRWFESEDEVRKFLSQPQN